MPEQRPDGGLALKLDQQSQAFLDGGSFRRQTADLHGSADQIVVDLDIGAHGNTTWVCIERTFGQARYLLADDVGLGKTPQLGMAAQYVALTSEKPVLILAPKNLLQQWQDELRTMLAVPSARWDRGRWITEDGAVWPAGADACPRRIGNFPTRLITAQSPAAEPLTRLRYGCIVLDEAHRALQSGGLGNDRGPNKLLDFMLRIAERTETLLLGTATPIQTDRAELYDLMRILNAGCGRVLGGYGSPWRSRDDAMDMVAGRAPIPETPATCWAWLRDPLIPRGEHRTASRIRDELGAAENMASAPTPAIDGFSPALRNQIVFDAESLIRHHNPFVRHTIKRRRKDLKAPDGTSYFPEIGIRLHGETDDDALEMPASKRRPIRTRARSANGWRGYLWQGRFASFPLDGDYLLAAARYIELNPVRPGLVKRAEDWPWSSARAHLAACDDELAHAKPLLDMVGDWRALLSLEPDEDDMEVIRRHERTGRPLGDDAFIEHIEASLGRPMRPRKPGPKPRDGGAER